MHAVYRVPLRELTDDRHRISVRHPSGWIGPGFLIGDDNDVILWGFTGGIVARLFEFLGWIEELPDATGARPARLHARRTRRPPGLPPNTEFEEQDDE